MDNPFQYTTVTFWYVASLPEWPPQDEECNQLSISFLNSRFLPMTNFPFLLNSPPDKEKSLSEEGSFVTSTISFCKASSPCQDALILSSRSESGWWMEIVTHSTLETASAAWFSLPYLYSIMKSNSISFTNHFCWKAVESLWSRIYLRLLWLVLITNCLGNK